MQILHSQNNNTSMSFCAGNIVLRKIKAQNILQYDAIKKIAEEKELDIYIKKLKGSKFFPKSDCYTVYAKKEIDELPYKAQGQSLVIVNKYAKIAEISAKIYDAVIKSMEKLSSKIQI